MLFTATTVMEKHPLMGLLALSEVVAKLSFFMAWVWVYITISGRLGVAVDVLLFLALVWMAQVSCSHNESASCMDVNRSADYHSDCSVNWCYHSLSINELPAGVAFAKLSSKTHILDAGTERGSTPGSNRTAVLSTRPPNKCRSSGTRAL